MPINKLKDKYNGERIFILGNGPSLKQTPLHLLSDEYTFGVNNISNIFNKTEWRPSFYLAIHSPPNIPRDNVFKMIDLNIPCFFPRNGLTYVPERTNVKRVNLEHLSHKDDVDITGYNINWGSIGDYDGIWSSDISEVVYHYTTVLYPAMQIADYMGFSELYLLGCDLYDEWDLHMIFEKGDDPASYRPKYDSKIKRVYDFVSSADYPIRSIVNGIVHQAYDSILFRKTQPYLMRIDNRFANQAHFYDTYEVGHFLAGHQRRNEKMIRSHRLAREVSKERDFDIYNATLGGSLEVHPRIDLDELLAKQL